MAMKVGELFTEVDVRDGKFNKGIGKMQGALSSKLGVSSAAVGAATAGIAAVGAAAAAAGAKGVKEFTKFEKGMNEVFTLLPNASENMKKEMTKDLREFTTEMGVATEKAVPALYDSISSGIPKENVFTFMETAQKAAVAGSSSLKESVNMLTTVTKGYGDTSEETVQKVSDLALQTVRLGETTFPELASSMGKVTPLASSMGVKMESLFGAMSTLTGVTGSTSEVATQLRGVMSSLTKPTALMEQVIAQLGYESGKAMVEAEGLQGTLQILKGAVDGNQKKMAGMFGQVEALNAALALTGPQAENFTKKTKAMGKSAGTTDDAYKQMEKSLSRSFDKMKAAIQDVWLEIGKQLAPAVKDLANFITENMPIIKTTAKVAFKVIGLAIQGIIFPIDKTMDALRGLFNFLGMIKDVLTAPFRKAKKWLEGFSLKDIGQNIVQGAVDGIKSMAGKPVKAIKSIFGNAKSVAKNILGISSPSKEFEKIGINTTEGFTKGLENSKKSAIGRVSDMMSGIINVNQPQMAGSGGPQVIRLNITQNISDKETAEYANDDLVSKLQGRGVAGGFR